MIARILFPGFALFIAVGQVRAQDLTAPPRLPDGLEVATLISVGLQVSPLAALRQAVVGGSFPNTTSLLVLKDRNLVFEEYFGVGGREVLNDTRSAMKSVTALAVGAALADGALRSIDEPAFRWLADLTPFEHSGALKQGITLADLLTMSSALDCNDWDAASPATKRTCILAATGPVGPSTFR